MCVYIYIYVYIHMYIHNKYKLIVIVMHEIPEAEVRAAALASEGTEVQ